MNRKHSFKRILILGLITIIFAVLAGCAAPSENEMTSPSGAAESEPVTLTISAAASLTDALQEIQQLYAMEQPHVTLEFNFGSSGSLQQQIEQGAPADIFMSAAAKQMNELQEKSLLLDETRFDLLENELVLVVPVGSAGLTDFTDLNKEEIALIAIGDPASVPAGKYAQEALTTLGIWEEVEPKIVLAKDVRQVLAYVENEEVQAGAVYRTDANISDKVEIVATAPEGSHSPVIYPVAILKDSSQAETAGMLLDYLGGEKTRAVFEKYGFKPLH